MYWIYKVSFNKVSNKLFKSIKVIDFTYSRGIRRKSFRPFLMDYGVCIDLSLLPLRGRQFDSRVCVRSIKSCSFRKLWVARRGFAQMSFEPSYQEFELSPPSDRGARIHREQPRQKILPPSLPPLAFLPTLSLIVSYSNSIILLFARGEREKKEKKIFRGKIHQFSNLC